MDSYERELADILSDGDDNGDSFVYPGSSTNVQHNDANGSSPSISGSHSICSYGTQTSFSDASSTIRASSSYSHGDLYPESKEDAEGEVPADAAAWDSLPDEATRRKNQFEEAALEWQHDPRWEGEEEGPSQSAGPASKGKEKLGLSDYEKRMRDIMGDDEHDESERYSKNIEREQEATTPRPLQVSSFASQAQTSALQEADGEAQASGSGSEDDVDDGIFVFPGAAPAYRKQPPSPEPYDLSCSAADGKARSSAGVKSNPTGRPDDSVDSIVSDSVRSESSELPDVSVPSGNTGERSSTSTEAPTVSPPPARRKGKNVPSMRIAATVPIQTSADSSAPLLSKIGPPSSAGLCSFRVPSSSSTASIGNGSPSSSMSFTHSFISMGSSHKRQGKTDFVSRRPKEYPSLSRLRAGAFLNGEGSSCGDSKTPSARSSQLDLSSHLDGVDAQNFEVQPGGLGQRSVSVSSLAGSVCSVSQTKATRFYPYGAPNHQSPGAGPDAPTLDLTVYGTMTPTMCSATTSQIASAEASAAGALNRQFDGAGVPLTVEAGEQLMELHGKDIFRWGALRKVSNHVYGQNASFQCKRQRDDKKQQANGKQPETRARGEEAALSEKGVSQTNTLKGDHARSVRARGSHDESFSADGEAGMEPLQPMNDSEYEARASNVPGVDVSQSTNGGDSAKALHEPVRPTVLRASNGLIAVGMSDGKVMVFDYAQALIGTYGPKSITDAGGMVTALAFSHDHTFLGVGHAEGHIALYNLAKHAAPARHVTPAASAAISTGRNEGHLSGSKVIHLSFVGARHTAIVSADNAGLSFYHSLGKIVGIASDDTLRIFGRYPLHSPAVKASAGGATIQEGIHHSTILDMASLPLGDVPHITDGYLFTAVASPNKIVLCGVKPSARTWWRRKGHARPRQQEDAVEDMLEEMQHGGHTKPNGLSSVGRGHGFDADPATASLSWRVATAAAAPVLAFSLGREVSLLELHGVTLETQGKVREDVQLQERDTYEHSEPVLALRWLTGELLLLLGSRSIAVFDVGRWQLVDEQEKNEPIKSLLPQQWHPSRVVLGEASSIMRYPAKMVGNSLSITEGRLFLLGFHTVYVGSLLSWADCILSLVSSGDFLSAIRLCTAYYQGTAPGLAFGLPKDAATRQSLVGSRLRELMRASAQYVFSEDRFTDMTHVSSDGRGVDRTAIFENIASACAESSLILDDMHFLFNDLYDLYADNGIEGIFVAQMEKFILSNRMRRLPPEVIQKLILFHCDRAEFTRAEEIIWHVDVPCLDLDQALSVCKQHGLYDAMTYIFNSALGDFVTPLLELGDLIVQVMHLEANDTQEEEQRIGHAYKIFSYLSVILLGRQYPSQSKLEENVANRARAEVYGFLFAATAQSWPEAYRARLSAAAPEGNMFDLDYPALRLLISFDAEALLDALDIALEDPYLEEEEASQITRQGIIDAMIHIASALPGSVLIDIFIARNVHRYPQFLRLSGAIAFKILERLSKQGSDQDREDRQLAAESLLANEIQGGLKALLDDFEAAGFFRILQRAYRREKQWTRLVAMLLQDPEAEDSVFGEIQSIFAQCSRKSPMRKVLIDQIVFSSPRLANINVARTAQLIDSRAPDRHGDVVDALSDRPALQYSYLKGILNPEYAREQAERESKATQFPDWTKEEYITLMATFEPGSMLRNLETREPHFFDLDHVMNVAESKKVYDALLWTVNKTHGMEAAMDRLDRIIAQESSALQAEDDGLTGDTFASSRLHTAFDFGVRLCRDAPVDAIGEQWYRILRGLVQLTHSAAISQRATAMAKASTSSAAAAAAQGIVQDCLSSLIASASAEQVSFPTLFRRLISHQGHDDIPAAAQYYKDVRSVLESMLMAHHLRTDEMSIANRLFDRDISGVMHALTRERRRGWRPISFNQRCMRCGGALFGSNAPNANVASTESAAADTASPRSLAWRSSAFSHAQDARRASLTARGKSSVINLPSRPTSPYLEAFPSPSINKGKAPARGFFPSARSGSHDGTIGLGKPGGSGGAGNDVNNSNDAAAAAAALTPGGGGVSLDPRSDGFFTRGWSYHQATSSSAPMDHFPARPKPNDDQSFLGVAHDADVPRVAPARSPLERSRGASLGSTSSAAGAGFGFGLGLSSLGDGEAEERDDVASAFAVRASWRTLDCRGRAAGDGVVGEEEEGQEAEEEEEWQSELRRRRAAVVIYRHGEAWHQLCAPEQYYA